MALRDAITHAKGSDSASEASSILDRGTTCSTLYRSCAMSASAGTSSTPPPAAAGLKLDLKLLDGNAVELSGDVVVTTDGMAVTPSGMGFTPMQAGAPATGDDDWFATYSASGAAGAHGATGGAPASAERAEVVGGSGTRRPEEVAGLSPLLTPSNNKLCAALVDAF